MEYCYTVIAFLMTKDTEVCLLKARVCLLTLSFLVMPHQPSALAPSTDHRL